MSDQDEPVSINELSTNIASNRQWLDDVLGAQTAELTENELYQIRHTIYLWCGQNADELDFVKIHDANLEINPTNSLIPPEATAGVVYIVRNPLDVAISLSHHYACSLEVAISKLNNPHHKLARYSKKEPRLQVQQHLSSWSRHIESWLNNQDLNNVLAIRYEDLINKPVETFSKLALYLGFSADTSKLHRAIQNSSFQNVKSQESVSIFKEKPPEAKCFFRKGMTGQWRGVLSESQINEIVHNHQKMMRRFEYLDAHNQPQV